MKVYIYMKEKKNKQKDFLLHTYSTIISWNTRYYYKTLAFTRYSVGYAAIADKQDYPHQDFAQLIVFIISIEVYSDILTGGYAVTTTIYSYIFCIYRYYNNILLVTLYDWKSPIGNGITKPFVALWLSTPDEKAYF